MSNFKETKTYLNLMKAFVGESQTRNRYKFYAKAAKKQGFIQIANIFMETADNEHVHAKMFFNKLIDMGLDGESIVLSDLTCPLAFSEDTLKNIEYAANQELAGWTKTYPTFAQIAEDEGFKDIAVMFKLVGKVEELHEIRFKKLAENLKNHTVFKKDGKVFWKCNKCGYIIETLEAPQHCPACKVPQGYFEIFIETY